MSTPGTRQRPDLPGLVYGPVLVLSALLASPAVVLLAQGMISVTEMLTRYLVITVGCTVLWAVVRSILKAIIAQPSPSEPARDDRAITGVVVGPEVTQVMETKAPLDPDALDMTPEELIPLSLRKSRTPDRPVS